MIWDVHIELLKRIGDERGKVLHMLRSDAPFFKGFGEVYFSVVNPGVVKAWKRHRKTTQHMAAPIGSVRVVVYDSRPESPTFRKVQVVDIGEQNYSLIQIPPFLWYGFQCLSSTASILANCIDLPFDEAESERIDSSDPSIPYSWRPL